MNCGHVINKHIAAAIALGISFLCLTAPAHSQAPVNECDIRAAHPEDPKKVAPGSKFNEIEVSLAKTACQKATESYPGEARFWFQLGRVLDREGDNPTLVLDTYKKAVELDRQYVMAYLSLAELYISSDYGLRQDHDEMMKWINEAIRNNPGDSQSYYNIAQMYEYIIVKMNLTDAKDRLRTLVFQNHLESAKRGHTEALGEVGSLYALGEGVTQNCELGLRLMREARDKGSIYAKENYGRAYNECEQARNPGQNCEAFCSSNCSGNPIFQVCYPQCLSRCKGS